MRSRSSPHTTFTIVWMALVFLALIGSWYLMPNQWLIDLLIAFNAAAFVLYGLDKLFAIVKTGRVPERVLWLAAFAGGPVGALSGMWLFRHKTSKVSFQFVLMLVVLVEIAIVVYVVTRV